MKKKGFTLVELLAVIVILAIIALIATPMILNVINNAKKGASESSALGYIEGIEKYIVLNEVTKENNFSFEKGSGYNVEDIKDYIEIKGDKPTEGWICIGDKKEVEKAKLKINNYVIKYEDNKATVVDEEIGDMECSSGTVDTKDEEEIIEAGTCKAATTKSIDTALLASDGDSYAYGVEYNCNPGDGTTRTFFVLEDGDNTTLTNGSTGTTNTGEISLIMDRNIGSTVAWSEDGSNHKDDDVSLQGVTAKEYLANQTTGWVIDAKLPTGYQIAKAGGDTSWNIQNYTGFSLPTWLNSNFEDGITGYWTSSVNSAYDNIVWCGGARLAGPTVDNTTNYGVRPVITITKDKIS